MTATSVLPVGPLGMVLTGAVLAPPDPVLPEARASSEKGMTFILAAQNTAGWWGEEPGSTGDGGNPCIAVRALLGHGSTPARGPYWRQARKGIEWVMRR